MAKRIIRTGTTADPTGDSLKNAFTKVNDNFTELYNALGLDAGGLNIGAFEFSGSVISTTDSSAITIDQAVTVTSNLTVGGDIVPNVANGGNLGSLARPFRSLYVSNSTIFLGGVPLSLEPGTNELRVNNVPISQNITYADIPDAPTDISDLTDTEGLLNGESSNDGNLEFEAYYVYQSNMDEEATKFKGNRDNKPLNALRELRLSSRALDDTDTEISVRSQLDKLVEQPRISELTMTLTSDSTKTFDYEVTHISRNIYQTEYRGYTGRFVRSYSNDSGIIRVIVGRGNVSTVLFDPRANNEDWLVNTGNCSTIMSFMIADHSAYIRKDREKITKFFEAVIDNIAFNGATEITDAAVMRTRFYANIDTLVSAIGGNLYYDFRAYNSTRNFVNVPISSATSTVPAGITIRAQNTGKYQNNGIDTAGEGFQVGQTIVILGSSLDQYSEDLGQQQNGVHNATVTITEVDGVGGITAYTVSGVGIGRWGSDEISDGEDDQFDGSMRYQTNLLQTLYRSDGSSQVSLDYLNYNGGLVTEDDRAADAFGAGSKYVISFHKGIVSLFATGVSNSVTWFSITGNSGRDGNGTVDEGEVRIGTVYRLFVRCLSGPEYFAVNNDKFLTTLRSTDRSGLIEIVNPNNDQNTVENDIYLQSLHSGDFYVKSNDRLILTANRDVTVQAGNGISSAREGYDVFIGGGDGIADDRLNSSPTGVGGDVYVESGQGGTIQHTITAMTNASPTVITLADRIRIDEYTLVSFSLDGDLGNSINSNTSYYALQISETEIAIYTQIGSSPLDTSSMPAFTSGTMIIGDRAGNVRISSLHPAAIFHGELTLNNFQWPTNHNEVLEGQYLRIKTSGFNPVLEFAGDITAAIARNIEAEGDVNIRVNLTDSTQRIWRFGEDGDLTVAGAIQANDNLTLRTSGGIPTSVSNINSQGGYNIGSYTGLTTTGGSGSGLTVNASTPGNGYISTITIVTPGTGYTDGDTITLVGGDGFGCTFTISTMPAWTFGTDGRTIFPTATAPAHSYGAAGDVAGMVAFDSGYIYYCTANYVDNSTDIWKRVALSATPW